MSFNPIERLEKGNLDFVFNLTDYDRNHLIAEVRKRKNRVRIINGFIYQLKDYLPSFCFSIIYDIPEFAKVARELFNFKYINAEILNNMLNNSPAGIELLNEYLELFLSSSMSIDILNVIFKYILDNKNNNLIHKVSICNDLHVRYLFMNYLLNNYIEMIDDVYCDITKYTTSTTYESGEQISFAPELMNSEDVSKLAVALLVNNRVADYDKLKRFILKEYEYNYLASELLKPLFDFDPDTGNMIKDDLKEIKESTFSQDSSVLFKTSADYRFGMYMSHKDKIKKELLDEFEYKIRYFINTGNPNDSYSLFNSSDEDMLNIIYSHGLGNLLEKYAEKYMDLSKCKEYGYVKAGTTCNCYRLGDYVIKLIRMKWSYEDIICPDLYLFAKNYEEIYVRNKSGEVVAGLEVQKYLTKDARFVDPKYLKSFDDALKGLGYTRTDTLVNGTCGENAMLLDTYLDADCHNPEFLPKWFKECPIVVVDRDRIYPKDEIFVRQIRQFN